MLKNFEAYEEQVNLYLPPNIHFGCFDYKISRPWDWSSGMEFVILYDIFDYNSRTQLKLYFSAEPVHPGFNSNSMIICNAFLQTIEISSYTDCINLYTDGDKFRFHINNIIGGTQNVESLIHTVNISLNVFFGGNTFNLEPKNILSFLIKDSHRLEKLNEIKKDFE